MSRRLVQRLWQGGKRRRSSAAASARAGRRPGLRVEGLEGRELLAVTFKVFPVPGAVGGTEGITTGPDQALWFTETINNKIGRVTTTGVVSEVPLRQSSSQPSRITTGPDQALWFTLSGSDEIGRFDLQTGLTFFAIPKTANTTLSPQGITVGPDGALWFVESQGNQLGRITTDGTITQYPLPTANSNPKEIVLGPDNALWYTAGTSTIGRAVVGTAPGTGATTVTVTELKTPTAGADPRAITVGQDGALWFVEDFSSKIGRVTVDGQFTEFPTLTSTSLPDGITAGPDGALWFTEKNPNPQLGRITAIDTTAPDGTPVPVGTMSEFPLPKGTNSTNGFNQPFQITLNPSDGNLYFTDQAAQVIGEAVLTPPVSSNLVVTANPITATEGASTSGVIASFTETNSTTPASGFTATVDWGDGTTSFGSGASTGMGPPRAVTITADPVVKGKFNVNGTHTYPEESPAGSPFPVSITVVDTVNNVRSAPATTTATITDAPLTATFFPFNPTEGRPFTFQVATFTDPDPGATRTDYTVLIDWGDGQVTNGQVDPGFTQPGAAPSFNVLGTHAYVEEVTGPVPVRISISDVGGPPVSKTLLITVPDSPLILPATSPTINLAAGGKLSGTVARFTDVDLLGQKSDYTATITFDDGTTAPGDVQPEAGGNGHFSINLPASSAHTFIKEGAHTITVQVQDSGGAPTVRTQVNVQVADAPLVPGQVFDVTGVTRGGSPFNGPVATFSDPDPSDKPLEYRATIAWGDGLTSTGAVTQPGGPGTLFTVSGSHTFVREGTLPLAISIVDSGGASLALNGRSIVPDAPLSATGVPTLTARQKTSLGALLATFIDTDPLATAGDFQGTTIDWGDNTVTQAQVLPNLAGGGKFDVGGTHTYTVAGTYKISILVKDVGGAFAPATTSAVITPTPFFPLNGRLNPFSDSGPSNADGITNVRTPNFVGTAGPNALVQLFVQPEGAPGTSKALVGVTRADAFGNWNITIFNPLPDGAYAVIASASDANGDPNSIPALIGNGPLVIETSAPRITNAVFDPRTNVVKVVFHDNLAGLDPAALANPANYALTRFGLGGTTPAAVRAIGLSGTAQDTVATILLASGARQGQNTGLVLAINSSRISNRAGNLLDGSFLTAFPTGNNQPGSIFQGQFLPNGPAPTQAIPALFVIDTRGALQHELFLGRRRRR